MHGTMAEMSDNTDKFMWLVGMEGAALPCCDVGAFRQSGMVVEGV